MDIVHKVVPSESLIHVSVEGKILHCIMSRVIGTDATVYKAQCAEAPDVVGVGSSPKTAITAMCEKAKPYAKFPVVTIEEHAHV